MGKVISLPDLIKEQYNKLTDTQRKIADYFLKNENSTSFLTIDRLALQIGVSPSSLTRFATELGFQGYPDLQKRLRENLQHKLNPAFRLTSGISQDKNDVFVRSFQKDLSSLQETMQLNSPKMMESVVNLLRKSKNIYIIAHRSSYSIASYMHAVLEPILGNVTLVNTIERMHTEYLLRMSEQDVLISISFPRYHLETVEFTELAKNQGVKVFAITDSMVSPLIQYADTYLLSKYESVNFHNSNVSALALVNSISASLAACLEEQVKARLNLIEKLNEEINNTK